MRVRLIFGEGLQLYPILREEWWAAIQGAELQEPGGGLHQPDQHGASRSQAVHYLPFFFGAF